MLVQASGGERWNRRYETDTVGQYGKEDLIGRYIDDQGKTCEKSSEGQLKLC